MEAAVIIGSWRLRHNEPGDGELRIVPLGIELDPDLKSLVMDLEPHGVPNIAGTFGPLALAAIDGDDVDLVALTTRQDSHRVHFMRPGILETSPHRDLGPTLRRAFQRWHLHLNNFECCVFPVQTAPDAWHAVLDLPHVLPAAEAVVEEIDAGNWSGFHLHSGSEISRFVSQVTVLNSLAEDEIVTVRPGCRRKKAGFDSPGWHVEIFRSVDGKWHRSMVSEPKALDLRDFDQRPEHVAALSGSPPLRRIGAIRESLLRIGVESGWSNALFEVDIAFRSVEDGAIAEAGRALAGRLVAVRAPAGRRVLAREEVERDLDRLAAHLQRLFGTSLAAPCPGEAPGGILPSFSRTHGERT